MFCFAGAVIRGVLLVLAFVVEALSLRDLAGMVPEILFVICSVLLVFEFCMFLSLFRNTQTVSVISFV